jgi:serine/threonine protein kinase
MSINVTDDLSEYLTLDVSTEDQSFIRGKLTDTGVTLFKESNVRNFKTDQIFAIKKVVLKNQDDKDLEARISELEQMNLQGSVLYYGCFCNKTIAWIVMSLVEGKRLQQLIGEETLTDNQKLLIAKLLASSIEECHLKTITHGEIQPANIMVKFDSGSTPINVILVDFGLPTTCCKISIAEPGYIYPYGTHFLKELIRKNKEALVISDHNPEVRGYNPTKLELLIKSDWWAYGQVIVYMYSGKKLFEEVDYNIYANISDSQRKADDNKIIAIIDEKKRFGLSFSHKIPKSEFRNILRLLTTTNNHPNLIPSSISIMNSLTLALWRTKKSHFQPSDKSYFEK